MNKQTIIENWGFAFNSIWDPPLIRKKNQRLRIQLQFYIKNPFKTEYGPKKIHTKIEIAFNFIRGNPLKMNRIKILHKVPFH